MEDLLRSKVLEMMVRKEYLKKYDTKEIEFTNTKWVEIKRIKKEEIKKYEKVEKLRLSYDLFTKKLDLAFLPEMRTVKELTIRLLDADWDEEYYVGSGYEGEWLLTFFHIDDIEHIVDLTGIEKKFPNLKKLEISGHRPSLYIETLEPIIKLVKLEELKLEITATLDDKLFSVLSKCRKLRIIKIGNESDFMECEYSSPHDEGIKEEEMLLNNVEELIIEGIDEKEYLEGKKNFFKKWKNLKKIKLGYSKEEIVLKEI